MKFKEFVKWCNDRAADGCWNRQSLTICIAILDELKDIKWWRRNKYWKEKYEHDVLKDIVIPINEKRKTWLGDK